ncbi:Dual specificity mitogen-activated protein kinase kinase 6, partial [Eschrichtius robustus]|nr:Dual specificity mitogen-activated protein kinase kinase 6 [Eschrichtius robustus]
MPSQTDMDRIQCQLTQYKLSVSVHHLMLLADSLSPQASCFTTWEQVSSSRRQTGFHLEYGNNDTYRPPRDLDSKACISIGNQNFEVKADDLEPIVELGRGAYGVVEKMRHVPSGQIMAVKRIRATVNSQEQKRLLMDLDISMRTVDCPFTVTFYGALFREGDVWICMELMDTSLDKFYKQVIDKGQTIPEDILGKIAVSIVKALEHLHSKLSVIHRVDGIESGKRTEEGLSFGTG